MQWICTLTDSNGISIQLSATFPSKLLFDIVYIAVKNDKCHLPINVFCQANKSDLKIPLKETWSLGKNEVFLYGLHNRKFDGESYDEVICFGKREIEIKEHAQVNAAIDITSGDKVELPGYSTCKNYIDVKVESQTRSKYKLRHEFVHKRPVEHLIFINFWNKLFIRAVRMKSFDYNIPINFPSASNVLCVVYTTVPQLNENGDSGRIYISKTTSSSSQLIIETGGITAEESWILALRDVNDGTFPLRINCPKRSSFNTLYILVINNEDSSSNHFFVNTSNGNSSGVTLSLNLKMSLYGWKIYVIGLQTMLKYSVAVYHGFIDLHFPLDDSVWLDLNLTECQDIELPLQILTQGTLTLSIFRQPPSIYRVDVNHVFSQEQDFIVFVKLCGQLRCYIFLQCRVVKEPFPFEIPSATTVSCKVICTSRHQNEARRVKGSTTISHSQVITFKSFLSLVDMYRLFNLALEFSSRKPTTNLRPIQYFYRNKSIQYFEDILDRLGGEMRPYLKSNGGEQGSVLNGRLPGLFFSTYLDSITNLPNPSSHYGPIRLYVNALAMFNSTCNLYFADFYCHYKRHHVTILLTPRTSSCNTFCRQYLTELNIYNNPYLCLQATPHGTYDVLANMDVTTEVFYTETINVRNILAFNLGKIEGTGIIGRGFAPPNGIPKNNVCTFCNLK